MKISENKIHKRELIFKWVTSLRRLQEQSDLSLSMDFGKYHLFIGYDCIELTIDDCERSCGLQRFFRENSIKVLENYYDLFLYQIKHLRDKFTDILDGNTVLLATELVKFYKLKQEKNDIMSALMLSNDMGQPYEEIYKRVKSLRDWHTKIRKVIEG